MSPEVIIMKKEDKELNKVFSANIKYLISRSGKRQQDVAAELGVPRTTFNNWCVGKVLPSLPKLRALAEYFNVEEDALVRPLVGNSIMFSMQLTGEELDLVNAFRAASPNQRSVAMRVLQAQPAPSIVPDRAEIEALIARTAKSGEDIRKMVDEAVARVESSASGLERFRELQKQRAAEYAALVGKKEGAE